MNVAILVAVLVVMYGAIVSRLADIQDKLDLLIKQSKKKEVCGE